MAVDVPDVFGGGVGVVEAEVAPRPPNSRAIPKLRQIDLACPMCRIAVGLGREPGLDRAAEPPAGRILGHFLPQEILARGIAPRLIGRDGRIDRGHRSKLMAARGATNARRALNPAIDESAREGSRALRVLVLQAAYTSSPTSAAASCGAGATGSSTRGGGASKPAGGWMSISA